MTPESGPPLVEALGVRKGDQVALVGGGGKTGLMYRLVAELRSRGINAHAATTTRIALPVAGEPELLCAETWDALVPALEGPPRVVGRRLLPGGKVQGIPPEWCDRLLAEGRCAVLVVEADGAARRPLKAPAAWEPVVAVGATLFVAVVGLSCLGRPLEATAFRPERVEVVTGLGSGDIVQPVDLARLLAATDGLCKGWRPGMRAVAVLNQADLPGARQGAAAVARELLALRSVYARVVATSLRRDPPVVAVWQRP